MMAGMPMPGGGNDVMGMWAIAFSNAPIIKSEAPPASEESSVADEESG